jgi:hypothetical protein
VLFGQSGNDRLNGGTGINTFVPGSGHNQCTENGAALVCPLPRR